MTFEFDEHWDETQIAMIKEAEEDYLLAEEYRRSDFLFDIFGPVMPNGRRLKDCTLTEMGALIRACKTEAVALNKLWDEAAAMFYPKQYKYDDVPDIVFRTLFAILLSLAEDKGVNGDSVMDLLLGATSSVHRSVLRNRGRQQAA
jgi:hypothetical protein